MATQTYFNGFYRGKKVLVTGHTGFKGGWLALWLKELGAVVYGISNEIQPESNLYSVVRHSWKAQRADCDIRQFHDLQSCIDHWQPEVIFHLAAQAIVSEGHRWPTNTFETNVMGTANVLEAARQMENKCKVVIVTSDKVYENLAWPTVPFDDRTLTFRENDRLGGRDPYSASKAAAEIITDCYRRNYFENDPKLGPVISVRAGNVIGGGDYAVNRIVPDCVRAAMHRKKLDVRMPQYTRPWQHVLDCLSGYLWAGAVVEKNNLKGTTFNFGPCDEDVRTVEDVVKAFEKLWPGFSWQHNPPKVPNFYESLHLQLSTTKARINLDWRPTWDFNVAVDQTVQWYRERHEQKGDMLKTSKEQIKFYQTCAEHRKAAWVRLEQ